MTWEQIESSWKQLKGDVQLQTKASSVTRRANFDARESVEAEFVSYKRSLHHGAAFIRRRNPVQGGPTGAPIQAGQAGTPVLGDQAGWTAAR